MHTRTRASSSHPRERARSSGSLIGAVRSIERRRTDERRAFFVASVRGYFFSAAERATWHVTRARLRTEGAREPLRGVRRRSRVSLPLPPSIPPARVSATRGPSDDVSRAPARIVNLLVNRRPRPAPPAIALPAPVPARARGARSPRTARARAAPAHDAHLSVVTVTLSDPPRSPCDPAPWPSPDDARVRGAHPGAFHHDPRNANRAAAAAAIDDEEKKPAAALPGGDFSFGARAAAAPRRSFSIPGLGEEADDSRSPPRAFELETARSYPGPLPPSRGPSSADDAAADGVGRGDARV